MQFVHAAWYLRSRGATIEWSPLVTPQGRAYKVYDITDDVPPIWLLPKAVCSLAELHQSEAEKASGK